MRGQCDGERSIRIRPDQNQYIHFLSAGGKVDLNLAEVGLDALAGIMIERDESLDVGPPVPIHKAADCVVTGGVLMRIPQSLEDSLACVALLRRRGLVVVDDLQNRVVKRA